MTLTLGIWNQNGKSRNRQPSSLWQQPHFWGYIVQLQRGHASTCTLLITQAVVLGQLPDREQKVIPICLLNDTNHFVRGQNFTIRILATKASGVSGNARCKGYSPQPQIVEISQRRNIIRPESGTEVLFLSRQG
jgi:hypothetical protein